MLQLRSRHGLLTLFLLAVVARGAQAQAPTPVQWSARADDVASLSAGTTARVTLIAEIAPGWHIYSLTQKPGGPIALTISVPAGEPFVLAGAVNGPEPTVQSDATLGVPIELYSGLAEFSVPIKFAATTLAGAVEGRVSARFQVCSDTTCLPPRSITLPVRLQKRAQGSGR